MTLHPGKHRQDGRDTERSRRPRAGFAAIIIGSAGSLMFALVTAFLLLINGSFTLIVFGMLADSDPRWRARNEFLQLGLFAVPIVLVVLQWMLWDRFRGWFSTDDRDQP